MNFLGLRYIAGTSQLAFLRALYYNNCGILREKQL